MIITKLERTIFYLIVVVISIFLGSAYFLPMVDLPQHAGQVAALKSIIIGEAADPWFKDVELNYFTTYWIAYLSTLLITFFIPINYAINIVVGLAFLLFVISFSYLRKRFNGSNILDWVLLPCFFGFSYSWGFLTFLLAVPVGILLVIQNLNLLETNDNKYIIRILIVGILLYFSHMLIFLLFCLIVSCMTLVNSGYSLKIKLKQLIPFYMLALLIPFFLITSDFFMAKGLGEYLDAHYISYYGFFGARIAFVLLFPWSVDHNPLFPMEFFSVLLLALPFFIGCKLTNDLKKYTPFIIVLLAWFLLPEVMGRTNFVYQRFSLLIFPCYILIFEKKLEKLNLEQIKIKLVTSFIWIAVSLGLVSIPMIDIINFNKETASFKSLLADAPTNKRVLSLVYDPYNDKNIAAYVYIASWYQALKHGWVDFNFAWFPPQVIRYKVERVPESQLGFAWDPREFTRFRHCNYYDMLIVRVKSAEQRKVHEELMKKSTCSHHFLYQRSDWLIYAL